MNTHENTNRVLNRILAMEQYSLANYLLEAPPWAHRGDEPLWEAVQHMADDQQHYAERIGTLIVEREGMVDSANYPMRFTALNDLALDYLASRLVEHQRILIAQLADCVAQLEGDPPAHELAQEVLGAEKGHLDTLLELTSRQEERVAAA